MTLRNRDLPDPEYPRRLNRFADIAAPDSPLSAAFARAAAHDPIAHRILDAAPAAQPAANVLLAAVQYLLLAGADHPLAAHYPASAPPGAVPEGDPATAFLDFCRIHHAALTELAATRGTQTNEVRRCVALMPGLARVDGEPLSLIEVGASAGLNLCFDRYRYDIGGVTTGPVDSPVTLTTEVRAGFPLVPEPLPRVAWRVGIDLDPIDLDDPDSVRWARALLWPEQLDRIARFEAAVDLVRPDPPRIERGDALELVSALAAEAPLDTSLVVLHSFVLNQFTEEQRQQFDATLRELSRARPIDRVSMEMLHSDLAFPEIEHTRYRAGEAITDLVGTAHHHGAWLAWAG